MYYLNTLSDPNKNNHNFTPDVWNHFEAFAAQRLLKATISFKSKSFRAFAAQTF